MSLWVFRGTLYADRRDQVSAPGLVAAALTALAALAVAARTLERRNRLLRTTPAAALATALARLAATTDRQRRQRVTAARLGHDFRTRITGLHTSNRDRRCVLIHSRSGSAHLVMILH